MEKKSRANRTKAELWSTPYRKKGPRSTELLHWQLRCSVLRFCPFVRSILSI